MWPHDGTEATEWHMMVSVPGPSEQTQGSCGYAEFTRPWSVDAIHEPFVNAMLLRKGVHYICPYHRK